MFEAALRFRLTKQQRHGKLRRGKLQRIQKRVIGKKLVGTRADHQLWRNLFRIGGHFQPAMAEKRIDGCSADFHQSEKDEIELRDIW
ncbi:hypothetical protein D3C71_1687920 [compost metagenome]